TSGPNTKPMSPKNRNTPTAVPDRRSGATSESIEDGATATVPDPTPMSPRNTPNTSGDVANPPTATVAANHMSPGITSARRPNRAAHVPAGYRNTSSAATATASTAPIPTVVMCRPY